MPASRKLRGVSGTLAVRRAFLAHGPVASSSQIYNWVFPRKRKLTQLRRHGVWGILREVAVPIGRAPTLGRPWLWRLRNTEENPE
jgi:hypothetical protein